MGAVAQGFKLLGKPFEDVRMESGKLFCLRRIFGQFVARCAASLSQLRSGHGGFGETGVAVWTGSRNGEPDW